MFNRCDRYINIPLYFVLVKDPTKVCCVPVSLLSFSVIHVVVCDRCDRYTNVPPYCVLVKDPTNQCCMKPLCTPPATQHPPQQSTLSPPGVSTQAPPQQSTVSPPVNPQSTQQPPLPSIIAPTPGPREKIVHGRQALFARVQKKKEKQFWRKTLKLLKRTL